MLYPLLIFFALASLGLSQEPVSYSRQIHPILMKQCSGCHQPDSKQSGLLVTTYEGLKQGGQKGAGFVPGKPEESLVIAYLTGKMQPRMPFGGKPLPEADVALFRRWIEEGAKFDGAAEPAPAARREATVYHAPPLVTAMSFSPDGALLALSGYHEILLHHADGSGLVARLPGASQRIHSVLFSADGKTLVAVGGDPARFGELQIWDLTSRKQRHSVMLTNDTLSGAALSQDGSKVVFCSTDKSLRLYDVASGKELRKMDFHEEWPFATVFGVDGKRIVSVGRDRAAKLIDVETGRFVENVNLLREPLTALARHPKRDWILIGGQERIPYLYRMDRPRAMRIADDSTLIRKFEKQDGPIQALAISPDGKLAAVASEIGDVKIYDVETGARVANCAGHEGSIYSLAFHPDGKRLATAGFDGTVRIYGIDGKVAKAFVPVTLEKREVAGAR